MQFIFFLVVSFGLTCDTVLASDTDNLNCYENICYPKEYQNNPKMPKDVTVYFDFEMTGAEMKKVDDNEMMITFAPDIIMIWNDPRLRLPSNATFLEWAKLSDELLEKIWYPKVTVEDKTPRASSFQDMGKTCKHVLINFNSLVQNVKH